MWNLTIEDDAGLRLLIPLEQPEYTLGREPGNDLRLTDRNVSRRHATLRQASDRWLIEDKGSYNGCFVNGQRVIGATPLSDGDLIHLGDLRLYVNEDTSASPSGVDPQAHMAARPALPDRLVEIVGPKPGREYPLEQETTTLGRIPECTIVLNHPSVSRVHAEIRPLATGVFEVLDRGSANGVRVNGTEIERGFIEAGDALEIGQVKLRFIGRGQFYVPSADTSQRVLAINEITLRPPPAAKANSKLIIFGILGILAIGALSFFVVSLVTGK